MKRMNARLLTPLAALAIAAGSAHAAVVFQDDFNGTASDINGLAPDIAPGAETWVAANTFDANGAIADTAGASATLAFTPANGFIYTLDASFRNFANAGVTNPENDWIAMGFANGQSSAIGNNERFVGGNVNGIAWMLMRGNTTGSVGNTAFRGLSTSGTNLNTGGAAWTDAPLAGTFGSDLDMRVVLDTTGGTGTWTATWYAKLAADASYTEVRATELLADEAITSVGLARSNTGFTGNVTSFSLNSVPEPGSLALLGLGGLCVLRRRRA